MAVDDRSERFRGKLATDFVGQRPNPHNCVRVTFARAAYDKKCKCCAGRRRTDYLIRRTRANQLTDQLAVINKRLGR